MTPHEEMVLSEGWPPQVPPEDWAHNKVQKGDVLMYQELQLCQLLPVCGICTPLRGSEAQGNSPVSGKGLQDPTKVPETPLCYQQFGIYTGPLHHCPALHSFLGP